MARQSRRRARPRARPRGLDFSTLAGRARRDRAAGAVVAVDAQRPARAGRGADRHRRIATALGRFVGDRDRHRRRRGRAGGDAGNGRRLQGNTRPHLKIVEGRKFGGGLRALVAARGAQKQFRGLEVGKQLKLANQMWTVVGVFAANDSHDSELWADVDVLGPAYQRQAFQSVTVKLDGKNGFQQLKAALAADPRLKLDVSTTHDYYAKQSEHLTKLINILGTVIGTIMAIGAV